MNLMNPKCIEFKRVACIYHLIVSIKPQCILNIIGVLQKDIMNVFILK